MRPSLRGRLLEGLARWLAVPLWPTDSDGAEASWWVYGDDGGGVWTTSRLGVLNGLLRRLGLVVVRYTDGERGGVPAPPYLALRRVWW